MMIKKRRFAPAIVLLIGVTFVNAAEQASPPTYSSVVADLRKASVPIREIGTKGKIAVTLAAGRVVAMSFSTNDINLLWSHPQLGDTELVKEKPETLSGGFGGDRLWFAPELAYNWDGKPNWDTFANYKTPSAMDPGAYEFDKHDARSVSLHATGQLPVHGTNHKVGFDVSRDIRVVDAPLSPDHPLMLAVQYVGIETSHVLNIIEGTHKGQLDLWHLLQAPVGSVLIVPIKQAASGTQVKPLSYGLPGAWVEKPDHIMWRYGGEARAKFGLSAAALTGRTAILRELNPGRWCLIVREFPVQPTSIYGDHPYGLPRTDQAFQAWDGYGFGEMEFHSPVLDSERGPRRLTESDRLWAFGGTAQQMTGLAKELLAVDIGYIFAR